MKISQTPFRFFFLTLICLGCVAAAAAQTGASAGTPDAVVRELYRVHRNGYGHVFEKEGRKYQQKFFDKQLADLIWKDLTETPEGDVGNLDFDPLFNAQDTKITNFRVGAPAINGDRADVPVTFNNFGKPNKLAFRMHKTSEGWKVENIFYHGNGDDFDLIKILSGTPQ
ncbi:MAG: YbjP/YqhG family protein [Acidobacteriota bacterium]|nr:YbjP/YqhG family protein [Acidobacteriota bacterium]